MIAALALARRLWSHPAVRGITLCVGILVALKGYGMLRYHDGRKAGIAQERAIADSTTAIAKQTADAAWLELFNASAALRDSLRRVEATLATQTTQLAVASAKASSAEARYLALRHTDTTSSPALQACDEMATSCAQARAAAESYVEAADAVLETQRTMLNQRDSLIAAEPVRMQLAVDNGIRTWRQGHPAPSRKAAFIAGIATGLLSLLVAR